MLFKIRETSLILTLCIGLCLADAQIGDPVCHRDPPNCQGDALRHIPLHTEWYLNVTGSMSLALVDHHVTRTQNDGFRGQMSLVRISRCRVHAKIHAMPMGTAIESTEAVFVVSKRAIFKSCKSRGNATKEGLALLSNVISALFSTPRAALGNVKRLERDGFGVCRTVYNTVAKDNGSLMTTKSRDLQQCIAPHHWNTKTGGKTNKNAVLETWHCTQNMKNGIMHDVKCQHQTQFPKTAMYRENITIEYVHSHPADSSQLGSLWDVDTSQVLSRYSLDQSIRSGLDQLCTDLNNGFNSDTLQLIPSIISSLSLAKADDIVQLFTDIHFGFVCPGNDEILHIFSEMLRDTLSDAVSEAKCRILISGKSTNIADWASSLANTINPSPRTLETCTGLMDKPFWNEAIIGLAYLAQNVRRKSCLRRRKQHSCEHHQDFKMISRKLWSLARNCNNPSESYLQTTLLAMRGLRILESDEVDVTSTLISCASEAKYSQIVVASIQALGHKQCDKKVVDWLQTSIFNNTFEVSIRIEAFKSLLLCDRQIALEMAELIHDQRVDVNSRQLTSYVGSSLPHANSSYAGMPLSRSFGVDLGDLMGLEGKLKLSGDFISSESFIPRSASIKVESDLFKYLGRTFQFDARQENLEELLQPLFGPAGHFGTVQSFLYDILWKVINRVKEHDDPLTSESRSRQDEDLQDVRKIAGKIEREAASALKGWLSAYIDDQEVEFIPFKMNTQFPDIQTRIDEMITSNVNMLISFLLGHKVKQSSVWNLYNHEDTVWTLLGNNLRWHHYEGLALQLKSSAHVDALSILRGLFSPSLNIDVNPNFGFYKYQSLHWTLSDKDIEARTPSSMNAQFHLEMTIKPKDSENFELQLNLPSTSTHGWTKKSSKDLLVNPETNTEPTQCGACTETLDETNNYCLNPDGKSLGFRGCFTSKQSIHIGGTMKEERFLMEKTDESLEYLKIGVSSKNPGLNSYFLSAVVEKIGEGLSDETNIVVGLTYRPHLTLKILAQGRDQQASFEASIVDDLNLKRFEARSTIGKDEYGLKAELLMVKDGGQVSVKPRFVLSRPGSQEDSLFEGYLAHYSSDKMRSFTLDIASDGSLKQVFDIAMKGTTEARGNRSGDWSLKLKNLKLISPELNLGLETSLGRNKNHFDLSAQLDWDGELVTFGSSWGKFHNEVTDRVYELDCYFLNAEKPNWNTRMTLVTVLEHEHVKNNLTIRSGSAKKLRTLQIVHTSALHLLSHSVEDEQYTNTWFSGPTFKIINEVALKIPEDYIEWKLDHTLLISGLSIENKAVLVNKADKYVMMTNLYDQSEQQFKYHLELELSSLTWRFAYMGTLLEKGDGEYIGQFVARLPSGKKISSASRVVYERSVDLLLIRLTYDQQVQNAWTNSRLTMRSTLEHGLSNFNFQFLVEDPSPLVLVKLSLEELDSPHMKANTQILVKDLMKVEMAARSKSSTFELSTNARIDPYDRDVSSKLTFHVVPSEWMEVHSSLSWKSIKDPVYPEKSLSLLSTIKKESSVSYSTRSEIRLGEKAWTVELTTNLGSIENMKREVHITITQPNMEALKASSSLLLDNIGGIARLQAITDVTLPWNTVYKLVLDGETRSDFSNSSGHFYLTLVTPFTDAVTFRTRAIQMITNEQKKISFECFTSSEARYWQSLNATLSMDHSTDGAGLVDIGFSKDDAYHINLHGRIVPNDMHNAYNLTVDGELQILDRDTTLNYGLNLDGNVQTALSPPMVLISQTTKLKKNSASLVFSEGYLKIMIPHAEGALVIQHSGAILNNHAYNMKGKFTGKELESVLTGSIDSMPIRARIQFTDGKSVRLGGSYGDNSQASIGLETKLNRLIFGIQKAEDKPCKITTTGFITWKREKTRFIHVFRSNKVDVSSILRIQNIDDKPVKITVKRTKFSKNHFGTTGELVWGQQVVSYEDDVTLINVRQFEAAVKFRAPAVDLADIFCHIQSHHIDSNDQQISIQYTKNREDVYRGRFDVTVFPDESRPSMIILANITELILNEKPYEDIEMSHAFDLSSVNIMINSHISNGNTKVIEVMLDSLQPNEHLLVSMCSSNGKCFRVKAQATLKSEKSVFQHYEVDISALNSLLLDNDDDLIQHHLIISGTNEGDGTIISNVSFAREECMDVTCDDTNIIAIHDVGLTIVSRSLDVVYKNMNRTIAMKALLHLTDVMKGETNRLQLQIWLNKETRPDNFIEWNTSYTFIDQHIMEHKLSSSLHHGAMSRPITLEAEVVSAAALSHNINVFMDVFVDPHKALVIEARLRGNLDKIVFNASLEQSNGNKISSLEATMKASPVNGAFEVIALAPYTDSSCRDRTTSLAIECDVDMLPNRARQHCQVSSDSYSESWMFVYEKPSDPNCGGLTIGTVLYDDETSILAQLCKKWTSLETQVNLSDNSTDQLHLSVGHLSKNVFEILVPGVLNVNASLYPPYIVHLSAGKIENLSHQLSHLEAVLREKLDFILRKTKQMGSALIKDTALFEELHHKLFKQPSLVDEFASIITGEIEDSIHEVREDQLFLDMRTGLQVSIDYMSNALDDVIVTVKNSSQWIAPRLTSIEGHMLDWINQSKNMFLDSVTAIYQRSLDVLNDVRIVLYKTVRRYMSYVRKKTSFRDITDWLKEKLRVMIGWSVVPSISDLLKTLSYFSLKVLGLIYPVTGQYNSEMDHYLIPLPTSSYSLSEAVAQFTNPGILDSSSRVLMEELTSIKKGLANPGPIINRYLSPQNDFAVYYGDGVQTFDGLYHQLTPGCSHVLLKLLVNGNSSIYVASQATDSSSVGLLIELEDKSISISGNVEVTVDDEVVSLPYTTKSVRIRRSLTDITFLHEDVFGNEILSLVCHIDRPICIIEINGWLKSRATGLLEGGVDQMIFSKMSSDRISPDIANMWEESWTISCKSPTPITDRIQDEKLLAACDSYFRGHPSSIVSCQHLVSEEPFYAHCIGEGSSAIRAPSSSIGRSFQHIDRHLLTGKSVLPNARQRYQPLVNDDLVQNSSNCFLDSLTQTSKLSLCNSLSGYSTACNLQGVSIKTPTACSHQYLSSSTLMESHQVLVDLLLLVEEAGCSDTFERDLIQPLAHTVEQTIVISNISATMGAIGYGSSEGELKLYTHGADLLTIPQMFTLPYVPDYPSTTIGRLHDVIEAALTFPYREGSIRVLLVVACGNQDIPKFTEKTLIEMNKKRIIVYALINEDIDRRSRGIEHIIGMDSKFLYRIRDGKIFLTDYRSMKPPTSNIGKLAMQSGGGVFSVSSLRYQHAKLLIDQFRKVMTSAIFYVARDYHSRFRDME